MILAKWWSSCSATNRNRSIVRMGVCNLGWREYLKTCSSVSPSISFIVLVRISRNLFNSSSIGTASWFASLVFLFCRSVGLISRSPFMMSSNRPCQSGSRSMRWPRFSLMVHVPFILTDWMSGGIDLNFSSTRAGVPASRSMMDGKIFSCVLKSNFRLNHFSCFMSYNWNWHHVCWKTADARARS